MWNNALKYKHSLIVDEFKLDAMFLQYSGNLCNTVKASYLAKTTNTATLNGNKVFSYNCTYKARGCLRRGTTSWSTPAPSSRINSNSMPRSSKILAISAAPS